MSGLYGILQMGGQSLLAQQKGIEVTGHNIANVNTPGYSRQRVILEAGTPVPSPQGLVGTGVSAVEVERIYDRFLGLQINNATENLGRWEAQKSATERVEIVFNEASGSGLNQAMSEFWNAWQDLANNPSGNVERVSLLGKSEQMANLFQQTYDSLSQIQTELHAGIEGLVDEINMKASEIAGLNQRISVLETGGDNANDLRDKRDQALNKLSSMIDITTFEESNGSTTVTLGDGSALVKWYSSRELSTNSDTLGRQDVVWASKTDESINSSISGGKLKGWIEVNDVILPGYMSDLKDLANGIKNEVNSVHGNGFDLNGTVGGSFFSGTLEGGTFAVDSEIVADVDKIAASQTALGVPGDNSNAIAMVDLQNALTMGGPPATATFDDHYSEMVSSIGAAVAQAGTNFSNQEAVVTHLNNYRESVSGVSLDEEMINLVQFQHAYNAAAKLIATTNELLETLMSMV